MLRYLAVALHIWWRLRKAENRKEFVALLRLAFRHRGYVTWENWVKIGRGIGLVWPGPEEIIGLRWTAARPRVAGRYLYAPEGQKPMVVVIEWVYDSLAAPARPSGMELPVTDGAFDGYRWFGPIPDAPVN